MHDVMMMQKEKITNKSNLEKTSGHYSVEVFVPTPYGFACTCLGPAGGFMFSSFLLVNFCQLQFGSLIYKKYKESLPESCCLPNTICLRVSHSANLVCHNAKRAKQALGILGIL